MTENEHIPLLLPRIAGGDVWSKSSNSLLDSAKGHEAIRLGHAMLIAAGRIRDHGIRRASMASPVVRGYVLKQSFSFIEKRFNPAMAAKVMATLPREVIELKGGTKDASWYPRAHFATLLRGIASARNDEKGSYEDLVACGEFIASEAANTFLKLVLKILTPRLFAKKIPELWDRDHQGGGRFEVTAVDDRHIDLNLLDVKGFDHIGCISVGWIMFGLKAMGKNEVVVDLKGWSLREPGPEQVHYRIEWS